MPLRVCVPIRLRTPRPRSEPRTQRLSRNVILGKATACARSTRLDRGNRATAKSHWLLWCDYALHSQACQEKKKRGTVSHHKALRSVKESRGCAGVQDVAMA